MPNSSTEIIWIPVFKYYVVICGSKNRHQKDLHAKEIRLHAQNMITILGSMVNMIGGAYMTS